MKCMNNTKKIEYRVRKKTSGCDSKFEDFFYDTFYVPEGLCSLPRDILRLPYYQQYFSDLGSRKGDLCYEAFDTRTSAVIGAVWTRFIINDIKIDTNTPYLLISVSAEYRGRGIGSALLHRILSELKGNGYEKVVLSVHRHNRAVALYERFGFSIVDSDNESYMMVRLLQTENV